MPAQTPALLSPPDAYMYVAKDGQKKAEMTVAKTFTMALYAGAYIAFGGFLGLAVVSNCPNLVAANPGLGKLLFALLFPVGLTMNTLHGTGASAVCGRGRAWRRWPAAGLAAAASA